MNPDRHLLHVGVHKTGSTWLQQHVFPGAQATTYADPLVSAFVGNLLRADDATFHEDAFRALVREFDQRGIRLLISNEALSGAVWRGGLPGDRAARRLASVIPNAEVVVLVRNQPEMLIALYAQYVNEGGTRSLGDFLTGDHPGPPLDHDALAYDSVVSAYRDSFEGHVWVVPYERVRQDPMSFLTELDQRYHLGLTEPSLRRVNVSLSPAGLAALRAWNRLFRASFFNPDPALGSLPGGRRVRNLTQQVLDPLFRQLVPERAMEARVEVARAHATTYEQSNARLAKLCDYELSELGYPLPGARA